MAESHMTVQHDNWFVEFVYKTKQTAHSHTQNQPNQIQMCQLCAITNLTTHFVMNQRRVSQRICLSALTQLTVCAQIERPYCYQNNYIAV